VTGIGFLGAGSIIGSGKNVQGITTAATLWVVAGVGLAVGVGEYILAIVTSVIIFLILIMKEAEVELHKIK
jgi:putative Mg2+ transporter-C (MgtC) family protein